MIQWAADYTPRAREQRAAQPRTVRRLFDQAVAELTTTPWLADSMDLETSWFTRRVGRWGTVRYALPRLGWITVLECRWEEPDFDTHIDAVRDSEHARLAWRDLAHGDLCG